MNKSFYKEYQVETKDGNIYHFWSSAFYDLDTDEKRFFFTDEGYWIPYFQILRIKKTGNKKEYKRY